MLVLYHLNNTSRNSRSQLFMSHLWIQWIIALSRSFESVTTPERFIHDLIVFHKVLPFPAQFNGSGDQSWLTMLLGIFLNKKNLNYKKIKIKITKIKWKLRD